jgi:hypothetical protein
MLVFLIVSQSESREPAPALQRLMRPHARTPLACASIAV